MMRTIRMFMVAVLLSLTSLVCQALPERPEPQRLVNDLAGIFSAQQVSLLEAELVAFDDSTSNQIAVVTVADLEGDSASSYAYRIGEKWGIGSEDFNNGIVLLIKPKTNEESGQVSIQVGYGLEGAIPDAYCKRIINNTLLPKFQEGDYYGGVQDACEELKALACGEISEPRGSDEIDKVSELLVRLFLFFLVMFILVRIMNRKNHGGGNWGSGSGDDFGRHIYIGPIGGWGSSFGGGSFGGGGSIGGFGGFGGGHFGGGGASGSW